MIIFLSVLSAVLPSIILLWYFRRQDRFPEPFGVMMMTFTLGVLSVIPILMVGYLLAGLGENIPTLQDSVFGMAVFTAFALAAIPEESFKYLVLTGYSARRTAFEEPMDGLVYGVCASLGFATLENVMYVGLTGNMNVAILRSITAVPCHACLGAIMGYYVGMGKFSGNATAWRWKAWLIPVVLHGLYDLPLMWMANKYKDVDIENITGLDAAFIFGSIGTVLVVLIFALVLTVRLGKRLVAIQKEIVVLRSEDQVE
jgi:RsiW-degrading membrane proteinase PrsW (M82 family)